MPSDGDLLLLLRTGFNLFSVESPSDIMLAVVIFLKVSLRCCNPLSRLSASQSLCARCMRESTTPSSGLDGVRLIAREDFIKFAFNADN
jgi:hypothetical protein